MTSSAPKQQRTTSSKQAAPEDDDDPIFQSIASKTSVLITPQVTLTCYIPTQAVGAVIGRRGSTMLQIQRYAMQYGTVRVSILHDADIDNVPYTFTELDWSDPEWTPVVVRGDACAACCATQRLRELCDEFDSLVILDVPLSRTKHASLVGKRGLVLQNLSADTHVRIMVPPRALRQDVIQLEGDLDDVKVCLEKILSILSTKRKPLEQASTMTMTTLPSQTKLRTVAKKTETVISKKKQEDETWLLTISGSQTDQVQAAMGMLEKWKEENEGKPSPQRKPKGRRPKSGKKGGRGGVVGSSAEQPAGS